MEQTIIIPAQKIDRRKGNSGRPLGATSCAKVPLKALCASLAPDTMVPVSRVWLEALGIVDSAVAVSAKSIPLPTEEPVAIQVTDFNS